MIYLTLSTTFPQIIFIVVPQLSEEKSTMKLIIFPLYLSLYIWFVKQQSTTQLGTYQGTFWYTRGLNTFLFCTSSFIAFIAISLTKISPTQHIILSLRRASLQFAKVRGTGSPKTFCLIISLSIFRLFTLNLSSIISEDSWSTVLGWEKNQPLHLQGVFFSLCQAYTQASQAKPAP